MKKKMIAVLMGLTMIAGNSSLADRRVFERVFIFRGKEVLIGESIAKL